MNGGGMDKQDIKLIDWRTVGGVTWRAACANVGTGWRQWRRPWLAAVACEGERVALVFETPIYPWTVIRAALVMEGL